ncbi:uncharacterized protein MYCFIDRAFT_82399 [Pseudocercospora fijiensis CIRAD86]|uniref:Uncharacterized protein n=1 Tax=Pseudocercospora fijiensis (strain CIRAD86) TaxID=383855 RepID=M2YXR7_PSEFD|nr:uncharacterized protein MYCFIDRAFT_82399 [Pseudocercospora fijiensis CIRAD86]EME82490.1 hypothetical protein MYCFIDRAFT_82399 [Pseudocercospora fijiensis CIRAD86]
MASTRFESGIDDASKPPGFSSTQQRRHGNDRFDFQRHVDGAAAGATGAWEFGSALDSFVDDRCPTIWNSSGKGVSLPKASIGRPLDAPISAEATKPVGDLRERASDGATLFASAIDPGVTNCPPPSSETARPPIFLPPQQDAADGATYFASAIDPGSRSEPAHARENQTRLLVPQELKKFAKRKKADGRAEEATGLVSGIDGGTCIRPPAPSAPSHAAIDAATLAPPDESLLNVPRATRIKPLDGDLLRKLFKHTMNEKQRAEESFRPAQEVKESSPSRKISKSPQGFHIPDRQDLRNARNAAKAGEERAAREQEAAKRQAAQSSAREPSNSGSAVSVGRSERVTSKDPTRMIRILAKSGEEAFIQVPNFAPSRPPSTKSEPPPPRQEAEKKKPAVRIPHSKKQKQSEKPNKKQDNPQKEESRRRAKAAKVAAEALMSGALPSKEHVTSEPGSAQDSGVGFGFGKAVSARSQAGSVARAESRSSSAKHVSASNKTPPTKALSAHGWQELAEATYKAAEPNPKPPSQASRTKSASVAEWLEFDAPAPATSVKPPSEKRYQTDWQELGEGKQQAESNRSMHVASVHSFQSIGEGWAKEQNAGARSVKPPSPSAESVKTRSQTGWEEIGEVEKHAASNRSVVSLRSFQPMGEGKQHVGSAKWPHRESNRSMMSLRSFQAIDGGWTQEQNAGAPSVRNFRQDDAAWMDGNASKHSLGTGRSRIASANRSRASFPGWQEMEMPPDRTPDAAVSIRSRIASATRSQASFQGWEEMPPERTPDAAVSMRSRIASATRSQASFQGWEEMPPDRTPDAAVSTRSHPSNIQSRQASNRASRSIERHAPPLVHLDEASPQLSHAWAQRDAQDIEPWPQYGELHRSSPSPSRVPLPRSVSVSQDSHHTEAGLEFQLPPRRTNTVSHHFEHSVHASSVRSQPRRNQISMHSLSAHEESDRIVPQGEDEPLPRLTAHAGRGWITPHPLSPTSSIAGPQSKVILPSDAHPNGRTLTYDEWKEMQERGLRLHRNISITESSKTKNGIFQDERYLRPGWEGHDREGPPEPEEAAEHVSRPPGRPSHYHSPTVRSEGSERSVMMPSAHAQTFQRSQEPCERLWEEMEEGVAGFAMPVSHAESGGSARAEMQQDIDRPASTVASFRSGRW